MIKRRWPETILAAVISLALFAWSSSIISSSGFWGFVLAFLGLLAGGFAFMGPASGPCPLCGTMNHHLYMMGRGEIQSCQHCRKYYRPADNKEAPADFIFRVPIFPVPIDRDARLPALCCFCGVPAERIKEVVHLGPGGQYQDKIIKEKVTVPVPYCAKHDENIQIQKFDVSASAPIGEGTGITDERWILRVRSYAFYRAAVLN
jgi:hypothetical protein